MRILVPNDPPYDRSRHFHEQSPYRARWVAHPDAPDGSGFDRPFVALYRLAFSCDSARTVRIHVSADERYTLTLDGRPLGRGPERGDPAHWCLETFDLPLSSGPHVLTARVQSLGRHRPYAQFSIRHGLLVLAEDDAETLLSTGVAKGWQAARIDAYSAIPVHLPRSFVATGARFAIDGAALSTDPDFRDVIDVGPAVPASARMESPGVWQLCPAQLPVQFELERTLGAVRHLDAAHPDKTFDTPVQPEQCLRAEVGGWDDLLCGEAPVVVPPHTTRRVVLDLGDYYCAYPRLTVSGGRGALVRLHFAEALFEKDGFTKQHRDRVEGLHFLGQGDDFRPDGSRQLAFEPLWFLAGRYVQLAVSTADEPLTLESLGFTETHYPFRWETTFKTSDERIAAFVPIALRAMEMCAHETYFDCPYYEQLMYVGDTRLECLVTYAMTRDDRLPKKAIRLFDQSRAGDGWTAARYPTKTTQTIPPFSLYWVAMVHDHMMWRDDRAFVLSCMPGVRAVIEAARDRVGGDGLYYPPQGWNFVDWIAHLGAPPPTSFARPEGAPPHGSGPYAPLHFHLAYTLRLAGDLEAFAGEPALAARHRDLADRMLAAGNAAFLDPARRLYRELPLGTALPAHDRFAEFTEHAQCMALLAGAVAPDRRKAFARALFSADDLARATIYFTHYLFETCAELADLGGEAALFSRLELWHSLPARGFKTTFEMPEPTRSDCHAWGAHPLYHLYATILGVRPASPGFKTVRIKPLLGPLTHASAALVHPKGTLTLDCRPSTATAKLPPGITGTLHLGPTPTPL